MAADRKGELIPDTTEGNAPATNYSAQPSMASGGAGLVSTASDYLRFAQMLLNKGELDSERILAPATIQLMISNHLGPIS
jgi:CubicO group peptidase (beta-lactamase class C family)